MTVPHRPSARRRTVALARSLLGLSLLSVPACNGAMGGAPGMDGGKDGGQEEQEERPTPVLLVTVELGTIQGQIRAASTIEAELQVTVHAESTGRITALELEEGDEIKAGQQLARIRRDAQSLGFERAETSLADAQRELDRVEKLLKQGIASQSEYDQAKSSVELAKLDKRDRRRDLSNTVVNAPFSGILTRRFVDEGAFVSNGAQIFEITDFTTLVARVYVPERELDRIAVGQPAEIVGKAAKNRQGTGEVRRIAPVVDATTGTVKVTIGLPDTLVGGTTGFLPGMYAEVTLTTEVHENVPLVPTPALVHDEEQTFVFIADGDRAKKVLLETGLSDDEFVEVTKGLEAGARIIVAGQSGLKDGALLLEVDAKGKPIGGDANPAVEGDVEQPSTLRKATKEGVAKAG
ncbi:efflux RND transporter periplasmic adaptor subunit [Enhygromyxa salina]|uniref:Multidrug resistance protein MdtA n=1 Tax=Enhygromyxa salina TaxID=215803 RepID=A0A2S9XNS8_9BACT|nr:efflux RND transporter periplasmic adaptor subunit [Enhygromyxa salina]PRP94341.1 Multidrug resistance protein MdtA precursor [Enhygromyxa salina]